MSKHCIDCGLPTHNGVCSSCQEELYIFENQYEFMEHPISDEFSQKIAQQVKLLNDRGRKP